MVMQGGGVRFVRDGQRYSGFTLGGGLLDAVHGNPRAEDEARTARNLEIGGWVFLVGGVGTLAGGIAVAGDGTHQHDSLVGGLFLTSIALDLVSLGFSLSAIPHVYDGMNLYNDDVDRALAPPQLVPVAPGALLTPPRLVSPPEPDAPPAQSAAPAAPAAPPSAAFPTP